MQDFVVKYDKLIRLFGWLIVGLTLWWWYNIVTSAHSIIETISGVIIVVGMGGIVVPIFMGIAEWYDGYYFSINRRDTNSRYRLYNDVKNKILNEEIQKRKGKDVKITNKIIRDVIKDIGKDELENRIEDVIKRFGGYESLEKNSRYSETSQKEYTSSTKRSGYSSRNSDFSNSSDIDYHHHGGDTFDGGGHHDITDYL